MADILDYTTGMIVKNYKAATFGLTFSKIPVIGDMIRRKVIIKTQVFEPKLIDKETASRQIQKSSKCAVGERICREVHKDSEYTEAIFLDELAEGMVNAGKARYVDVNEAVETLKKYPKNPLIMSKVSGKYTEICVSLPKTCIYWNMHRHGLRCIEVTSSGPKIK